MPAPVRVVHCPACRRERTARRVGKATVTGQPRDLVMCPERTCELVWAVCPDRQLTAA